MEAGASDEKNMKVVSDCFNFACEKVQEAFWKIDQRKDCRKRGFVCLFFVSKQTVTLNGSLHNRVSLIPVTVVASFGFVD